jgi:hypothetical protein
VTPSKDQTWESWALKKEKRCKPKGKFPKSQESFAHSGTEASRTPNRLDQNRTSLWHIIIKTTNTKYRERIPEAERKNK